MLEAFAVPFTFSDTATMALCLDKGKTKVEWAVLFTMHGVFKGKGEEGD
jgi:hypothetical protein